MEWRLLDENTEDIMVTTTGAENWTLVSIETIVHY